jgi:hypothetical protein
MNSRIKALIYLALIIIFIPKLSWPVAYRLPLSSNTSVHYYYDHDNTGSWQDWDCGTQSYNGHQGTDFSGGPRNRPIYAGSDGTINDRVDGFGDGYEGCPDGGGYGNHVGLSHPNSHTTIYAHMNLNSVTPKSIGDAVSCSEQIGGVGTSGNSTGLHLHFELRIGTTRTDPYTGDCSGASYWVYQNGATVGTDCENPNQYSCQWYAQSPNAWTWVKPGDIGNYMVQYTNTGTATWVNTGGVGVQNYVELWSCNSAGVICNSWFVPIGWINIQRVTTCDESSVIPGHRATFSFQAQIPSASSGDVRVYFRPTHGGQTMENWGGLSYNFHVDADPPSVPTGLTVTPPSNNINSFSFSWNASSDGQSGPEAYYWYVNSGSENRTTGISLPTGAYATQQGQNIFYVRCRDNVGNYSAYAQVPFTYSPGGCGPIPPWPPCSMRLDDGGEPLLVDLPSHSTQEWATGQTATDIIKPGFTYAISFWYHASLNSSFGWIMSGSGSPNKANWAATRVNNPVVDDTWHWFLSAPFEVTAEQLGSNPKLILDASSANQVEIKDVQMYVAPEPASKDAGSQTPAIEGGR